MRSNVMRCVVVYLATISLSGCYSGGQWTMPWSSKTSPFQTSSDAAKPGPVGSPTKPAGIAASTAPLSPYNNTASSATMPPVVTYPNTTPGYASTGVAQTTPQYPYPSTSSAQSTPATQGYPATAYTASTAGVPGAGAYGTSPVSSPASPATSAGSYKATSTPTASYGTAPVYNATNTASNGNSPSYGSSPSYSSSTTSPYSQPATASYSAPNSASYSAPTTPSNPSMGSAPSSYGAGAQSTAVQNGYPSTTASTNTPANPVRSMPSYSNSDSNQYGASAAGSVSGYNAPSADRSANLTAAPGVDRYSSGAVSSAPSSYDRGVGLPSGSGLRADNTSTTPNTDTGAMSNSLGNDRSSAGGDRYSPSSSSTVPLMGSRYATPGLSTPATGGSYYSAPASSYPTSGTSGGSTISPDSSYTPSANGSSDVPSYRPGGTSDYVPRSGGTQAGTPSTSSVTPVSYTQPQ